MLKELPVHDHVIFLHANVLVLNVFTPEAIVIVEVVHWLYESDFLWIGLDLVNFSVGLPVKVCHATFNLRLNLKVCNRHFLLKNACSLFSTLVTFNTCDHLLCYRQLIFLLLNAFIKHCSNVLVHFNHLIVGLFTDFMRI